jgi:hypothetical protein
VIENKSIRYLYKTRHSTNLHFFNIRIYSENIKDYYEHIKLLRYFNNGLWEIEDALYACELKMLSRNSSKLFSAFIKARLFFRQEFWGIKNGYKQFSKDYPDYLKGLYYWLEATYGKK